MDVGQRPTPPWSQVPTFYRAEWAHPWLRLQLVIRAMTATVWNAHQWPLVTPEFRQA
jgi:hypothetical protein